MSLKFPPDSEVGIIGLRIGQNLHVAAVQVLRALVALNSDCGTGSVMAMIASVAQLKSNGGAGNYAVELNFQAHGDVSAPGSNCVLGS